MPLEQFGASTGLILVPENDLTMKRQHAFAISGHMTRFSFEGDFYYPHEGISRKKRYFSISDGLVAKNSHDSDPSKEFPRTGFIAKDAQSFDANNYSTKPIIMFARPLQQSLGGIDIRDYQIEPKRGYIDGHECLLLVSTKHPWKNGKCIYWVDPKRSFVVCRYEEKVGSRDSMASAGFDVEFQENTLLDWVPLKWKVNENVGRQQFTMEGTHSEFNGNIAIDRFRTEFPEGTLVTDLRNSERFIASNNQGDKRIITEAEQKRGATYQQLLTTRSGEAKGKFASPANWWLRGLMLFSLIVFAVVCICRKWIKRT